MGRTLQSGDGSSAGARASASVSATTATKVVPAGYMGEFGSGLWRAFTLPGAHQFVVPAGVSKIRVRVVGAGARGNGAGRGGGGGGGYAHGVFDVTAGAAYTVTVGEGGANTAPGHGGASSFGALISATGGQAAEASPSSWPQAGGAGGYGVGGDFQANGGKGGDCPSSTYQCGGGGAGSQLGDGGRGGVTSTSYAGGGGIVGDALKEKGGSPFGNASTEAPGPSILGHWHLHLNASTGQFAAMNPLEAVIRFPFDGFTGAGGDSSSNGCRAGIGGGGGGISGGAAGVGGGGSQGGGGGAVQVWQPGYGQHGAVIVEW